MNLSRIHGRSFNDLTLDLNDILIFTRVVNCRSLTAAAAELGLPKSSVSRRLTQLEERLGVRLIQRTTRRFALTDIGEAYFERASRIVAEVTSANQLVTDMQSTPRGRLRISASVDMASRYLGQILSRFVAQHPDVNIEIDVTDRTVDLIDDGFDAAIRIANLRESSLIARKLASISANLYASPRYLSLRGTPSRIEELEHHDLCVFMPEGLAAIVLSNGTTSYELVSTPRLSSNNYAPMREALLAGGGIGYLSSFSVVDELAAGTLVQVLPEWSTGPIDVSIVYPARRNVPPRLSLFVDHVMREFDPPPWERKVVRAIAQPLLVAG